jgi:hypothetical protein
VRQAGEDIVDKGRGYVGEAFRGLQGKGEMALELGFAFCFFQGVWVGQGFGNTKPGLYCLPVW